jgi:hypothetical protein
MGSWIRITRCRRRERGILSGSLPKFHSSARRRGGLGVRIEGISFNLLDIWHNRGVTFCAYQLGGSMHTVEGDCFLIYSPIP